jgi:hypothetical protein
VIDVGFLRVIIVLVVSVKPVRVVVLIRLGEVFLMVNVWETVGILVRHCPLI